MRNKQIKNVLALIFSLSMLFSTVGTKTLSIRALENDTNVTTVVEADKKVELGENNNITRQKAPASLQQIDLKDEVVYMTLDFNVSEVIKSNKLDLTKIKWTYDGKPIEEVKTWALNAAGGYKGQQFVTVNGNIDGEDTKLEITFKSLFGSDLSERRKYGNIRREYRKQIGEHVLKGVSEDGNITITKNITLRPYEGFRSYEEMTQEVDAILAQNHNGRIIKLEEIGQSANGRPIKMAIIAQSEEAINQYLNETSPLMLKNPDKALALLKSGTLNYRVPILFNNTHADEQPGIDIVTELFKKFATEDMISYKTTVTDNGNEVDKDVKLNVNELLDKFIFLFDFTENPDGYVLNTRTLENGLDPNRDSGYQTNPETRAIVEQINKWNPISLLDFHGFVSDFLIEPATPPHDINFEYDLIADTALEEATQMGKAGVRNSKYDKFIIPKIAWGESWDDNFSGYTGVYALYHGILGHTVEIPEGNEESLQAGIHTGLAAVNYAKENLTKLFENKLTFFSRGVNKIEAKSANDILVDENKGSGGRPQIENGKFFPDYYVIPMSVTNDKNMEAAFKMVEYFKRNGVEVSQLKEDVGEYKKGDLVVDMAQAKRGYANHVLYRGVDLSSWDAMYAEVVMDFPVMRDFKSIAVYKDGLFDGKLGEVKHTKAPRSGVDDKATYYKVANSSIEAVKAVNSAIKNGKSVYLTDDGFIMDADTYKTLIKDYALFAEPLVDKKVTGKPIKSLKIYAPAHHYYWAGDFPIQSDTKNALEPLGFEFVDDADDADIYILESSAYDGDMIGKKPTIIIGGDAASRLEKLGLLAGFDVESTDDSHEGLLKATVTDDQSVLTSGYNKDDLFYTNSGSWIESLPDGFKSLLKINDENYYLAGWWPNNQKSAGKVVAISGTINDQDTLVYIGNPTNKTHTENFYRWISNFIYRGELAKVSDIKVNKPVTPTPLPGLGENNNFFMITSITVVIAGMTLLLKAKKKYN